MNPATMTAPPDRSSAGKAPSLLVPFTQAAKLHEEPIIDRTTTLTTSSQQLGPDDVPAYGYLRHIAMLVTATTSGNSATTAFTADGPWSALFEVALTDVNGAPLVGPVSGYDLYLINKYGGYAFMTDPRQAPDFTATTGSGATGGSFQFLLRIPVEISAGDGLGALANQNAAATYKLRYTLAQSSDIYSTAPTTLPGVRVRTWLEAWTQPAATDLRGNPQAVLPPSHGTTQYWSRFVATISAGQQTIRFPRVGNLLRTAVVVVRNAAAPSGRTAGLLPDPTQLIWDGRILTNRGERLWAHYIAEEYDLAGTIDAANGLDTGVYVYSWAWADSDGHPGWERHRSYIPTTQSTRFEITGSFGAGSTTVEILTNDVAPAGDLMSVA